MDVVYEFSRTVDVDDLKDKPRHESIEASAKECAALAKRFALLEIKALKAQIKLKREKGGSVINVEGTLDADVVQSCVVTLDPVPEHITAPFSAWFADSKDISPILQEEDLSIVENSPDEIVDGKIDIGELVAQHLSIELDPYPRAPHADLEKILQEKLPSDDSHNPFSVLSKLKTDTDK